MKKGKEEKVETQAYETLSVRTSAPGGVMTRENNEGSLVSCTLQRLRGARESGCQLETKTSLQNSESCIFQSKTLVVAADSEADS